MKTEISKTRSDLQDQIDDLQQGTHDTKSCLQDQIDNLQQGAYDTKSCLQDQIDDLQQLVGNLTLLVGGSRSPDHTENLSFLRACFLRSLHQGYMPAEKLIDLALGLDTRNLNGQTCDQLVQTLERAIDAHHVEVYNAKAGQA
jgi:hypothetical protein